MHRGYQYLFSCVLLSAALAAPSAVRAAAQPQDNGRQDEGRRDDKDRKRVYDRDHKDYHNWDDNEDRAYTQFRGSHKTYNVTFSKTTPKQQTTYWNWRHANPDKN